MMKTTLLQKDSSCLKGISGHLEFHVLSNYRDPRGLVSSLTTMAKVAAWVGEGGDLIGAVEQGLGCQNGAQERGGMYEKGSDIRGSLQGAHSLSYRAVVDYNSGKLESWIGNVLKWSSMSNSCLKREDDSSLHPHSSNLWKTHTDRSITQYKRFVLQRNCCSKRNLHRGTKFKNKQTTPIYHS